MLHKKPISVSALAIPVSVHIVSPRSSLTTVTLANTDNITSGTLAFRFAQAGSKVFELPIGPNVIDLANPKSITITDSFIGGVEVTLSDYVGTAAFIPLLVNTND